MSIKPLAVTDPRNPATLAAYIGYFIFGVFVGPGTYKSLSITSILPSWSENVWAYSLLFGGLLFLLGALWKRNLPVAFSLQAAGASGVFFGLVAYGLAIFIRANYNVPLMIFVMGLAVASLLRSLGCFQDLNKLLRFAQSPETVAVAAEPETVGEGP